MTVAPNKKQTARLFIADLWRKESTNLPMLKSECRPTAPSPLAPAAAAADILNSELEGADYDACRKHGGGNETCPGQALGRGGEPRAKRGCCRPKHKGRIGASCLVCIINALSRVRCQVFWKRTARKAV
jgi:hypothetical protein